MSKKTVTSYIIALWLTTTIGVAQELTPAEQLGKAIFFDTNLSINSNQACASCHNPEVGWTGPDPAINTAGAVYEGSISGLFGNRKPPSSAYATFSPILHYVIEKKEAQFIGGNFWDGRATGEKLGNPAADQAQGPFLNPLEQALPSPAEVVSRVCAADYASLFEHVWGGGICNPPVQVDTAYGNIARSIAAFEASPESNAFTSKYDYYLKGMVKLSKKEKKGLNLFKSKGKCASCHDLDASPNGQLPLLTDFTFDNIGVPRNPDNPFYAQTAFNPLGDRWTDLGLGDFLASRMDYNRFAAANNGKQKVPTLRNVAKGSCEANSTPDCIVKAYSHNGYFKSLKGIVHFYNTRDAKPACVNSFTTEADALIQNCWPEPEVAANVNTKELGNLQLTQKQEDAIVAFLKTLSDGYQP